MSKNKHITSITSVVIKCGYCNEEHTIPFSDFSISAYSQECELCGSHGEITIEVKCPKCQITSEITYKEW